MPIALSLIVDLFTPLQDAVQWLSGAGPSTAGDHLERTGSSAPSPRRQAMLPSTCGPTRCTERPVRAWGGPTRAPQSERPLRVVGLVGDAGAARVDAGRMVISGRLADVCAELDRLAALEATTA